MSYFSVEVVQGVVRHLLTSAGGAVLGDAVMKGQEAQGAVGLAVMLAGFAWSAFSKAQR